MGVFAALVMSSLLSSPYRRIPQTSPKSVTSTNSSQIAPTRATWRKETTQGTKEDA